MSRKFFSTIRMSALELLESAPEYGISTSLKEKAMIGLGLREGSNTSIPPSSDANPDQGLPDSERNKISGAPYVYSQLPSPSDSSKVIRLLEVLPGTRQDDICCLLREEELQSGPEYESISYCWGDITNKTPVQINDLTLEIGSNLRNALLDLRLKDKSRLLWADAICIDQSNLHERAEQVKIMGDIYKSALRTLVWLGNKIEFSEIAYDTLEILASEAGTEQIENTKQDSSTSNSQVDHAKKNQTFILRGIAALQEMIYVSWWTRAWVLQEVVLASEALIICGPREISWKRFTIAVEEAVRRNLFDTSVFGVYDDVPLDLVFSMNAIKQNPPTGTLAEQLLELLVYSRPRKATDPRDKVFSVMGLLRGDPKELGVSPDYQSPVEEIYCQTATVFIRSLNNLDVMSYCIPGKSTQLQNPLPSWVPDWSISVTTALSLQIDRFQKPRKSHATCNTSAHAQISDDSKHLIVSGHLLDTVAELSDVQEHMDSSVWDFEAEHELESLRETLASLMGDLSTIWKNCMMIPQYYNTFVTWEQFAMSHPCKVYGVERSEPKEVFWQTLSTNELASEGVRATEKLFEEWRSNLGPIRALRKMKVSKFPALFGTLGFAGFLWKTWNSYGAFSDMIPHAMGRRIGTTKSGWLCLLPSTTQVSDQVVLVKGGQMPMIVREKDGNWIHIGEAYVHGIMNGEAFNESLCHEMRFI